MSVPPPSRTGPHLVLAAMLASCAVAFTACGEDTPVQAPQRPRLTPVEFDYGTIPHGQTRWHDYEMDPSVLPSRHVPLRVQLDCSCGRGQLLLRAADGTLREIDGAPFPRNAPQAGETVIARVFVDTLLKDPIDLPHATSRGSVVMQPLDDMTGARRVTWPLILRFGIDCPVDVGPVASLDFAKVPLCGQQEKRLTLAGDENHADLRFLSVESTHPSIEPELIEDDGRRYLVVRCLPAEVGSFRGVVRVATDHPEGYSVNLSTTWKVVPTLEVYPLDKLTFRAHLDRAQTEQEASSQYLQIADHAAVDSAEFRVVELVGDDGRDASSCFEVRMQPIQGRARHQRVAVRYTGGLEQPFRGRLVLTPASDPSARLPIALVLFALRR